MENAPPAMVDREPDVEKMEADRRHDEEVHPGDHVPVIAQEGDPALLGARIGFGLRQVARDRGATYLNPELRQFGSDLPRPPVILRGHSADQLFRLFGDWRSSRSWCRDGSPVATESLSVPAGRSRSPAERRSERSSIAARSAKARPR